MSKKTGLNKKIVVLILAICSFLVACFFGAAIMVTSTNDLPKSCKSGFGVQVTDTCRQDIKNLAANYHVSNARAKCYDNFDYVDCQELANDAASARKWFLLSLATTLILGTTYFVLKSPKVKKKSAKTASRHKG